MNKSSQINETITEIKKPDKRSYASYLDDCFANYVGGAKVLLDTRQFNSAFHKIKTEFVHDLESAVKLNLSEDFGISKQNLIEMLELARKSDLSKIEDINSLYAIYHRMRG